MDEEGRVIVSGILDRETQAVHRLTVLAETNTSPALNAYYQLTIHVLDKNDEAPRFEANPYVATVSEEVTPHTSILRVEARDGDYGNNGQVRYSFLSDKHSQLFHIDPNQGWITTQVWQLTLICTFLGKKSLGEMAQIMSHNVDRKWTFSDILRRAGGITATMYLSYSA